MPGFSMCCAGIGDSGSSNTRGGAPRKAASFSAADSAVDFDADFFAAPFFEDFDPPFFAPCLFDLVAISSPVDANVPESFIGGGSVEGDLVRQDYRQAAAQISSLTIKFLSFHLSVG